MTHVGPQQVELRDVMLGEPGPGEVLVEAEYSAISPGTENLVFRGQVPEGMMLDETIASLCGSFSYPFEYGYALVGRVVGLGAGVVDSWLGTRVFAFHPHQDYLRVRVEDLLPVPEGLSAQAACFLPNMESACSFVMDVHPLLGERVLIIGQGVVGLLTTAVMSAFPLSTLVAVERLPNRRAWARRFGATEVLDAVPEAVERSVDRTDDPLAEAFDAVIEASGDPAALNAAIEVTGYDGRIVVASWYGQETASLDLGASFHRRRLRLIASQVSTLAPRLRGRWSKSRRFSLAWEWIGRIAPESLITHVFPLAHCQEAFMQTAAETGAIQVVFRYT